MKFLIVDAFAEKLFGGNPAGVIILPEGANFPSEEVMVKTASELRYSETAFISILGKNEFRIRYFTPAAEVNLCGHATLGAFCALAHLGIIKEGDKCINHTLAGDLEIEVGSGYVMMDMAAAQELLTIDTAERLKELYGVLGTKHTDKIKYLPEIISTGLPDIIVPVATKDELDSMKPDMKALSALSEKYNVTGIHAFALNENCQPNAYTRNFAPLYDIDEEAATGTSSGALTYYMYKNGIIEKDAQVTFLQGEAMKRPSWIKANIHSTENGCKIKVGGNAVVLAEGEINI